jgi:hypothetical protein
MGLGWYLDHRQLVERHRANDKALGRIMYISLGISGDVLSYLENKNAMFPSSKPLDNLNVKEIVDNYHEVLNYMIHNISDERKQIQNIEIK